MRKGIVFIFSLLLACSNSFGDDIELDVDCSSPKNMFRCAQIDATKNSMQYDSLISNIAKKMEEKRSEKYADDFTALEERWSNVLVDQCEHSGLLYEGGSLASTVSLGCYSAGYRARKYFLEKVYDDVISDR